MNWYIVKEAGEFFLLSSTSIGVGAWIRAFRDYPEAVRKLGRMRNIMPDPEDDDIEDDIGGEGRVYEQCPECRDSGMPCHLCFGAGQVYTNGMPSDLRHEVVPGWTLEELLAREG
jgi:hypothetical protein